MLLKHFGTTQGVIRQGPIIHNLAPSSTDPIRLRKAHPCREGISIWRPVRVGLGPENGLFKVYPGSHHIRTEDELRRSNIEPVEIRIRAEQVLIAYGGLWIEERSGNGLVMWMGVSTGIIGLCIDKYCLASVALAHGAERFLSRHQPPEMIQAEPGDAPGVLGLALQERLTKSHNRSKTAVEVLAHASTELESTGKFLWELRDPTELILRCDYSVGEDPRIAYLTTWHSTDSVWWFMRVLTLRYLAQRFHKVPGQTIVNFIREEDLPDNSSVTKGIENGVKMYAVETDCQNPGIWLVLMGEISKLPLMSIPEVRSTPQLLEQYGNLMNAASRWSSIMVDSSRLYELWMSELLSDARGRIVQGSSFN